MANREGSKHPPKSETLQRLGVALREVRKARGLSQRELAGDQYSGGHLSQVENGLVVPSTALLEHYASACGGNYAYLELMLREVLATSEHRRRERRASERGEVLYVPNAHDLYEEHDPFRLYSIASIESFISYDRHGIPTELRLLLSIRAKAYGLDRYYFGMGCHGDYRRGVVSLEGGPGCTIGHFDESDKGVHLGYFQLDRELSPSDSEPYSFSFHVDYRTHVRSDWPIMSQPRTDTARYVLTTQFTPPSIPKRVWWFDTATAVETEDDPRDDQIFRRDDSGFYRHVYERLTIGRMYGFNGEWE
ncbi:MAG TPA: helix-turn-helix transcriptional regulator [Actinocrinis sp.]|nr:helix-turn-helix transcriptional regulator [Actinocrinis sp.]